MCYKGHLFDRNVLNLLMDALVEAPSKFFVETIDVPQVKIVFLFLFFHFFILFKHLFFLFFFRKKVNDLPTSVIVCVKSADDVQGEEARAQVCFFNIFF